MTTIRIHLRGERRGSALCGAVGWDAAYASPWLQLVTCSRCRRRIVRILRGMRPAT